MEETFKQDIQLGLAVDSTQLELCRGFRKAQLLEEGENANGHSSLFKFLSENMHNNLLEVLGFVSSIPVGYAGFEPCACGCKDRLVWRCFYIPVQLRKYGLALKFGRSVVRYLKETVGENITIEVTHSSTNNAMSHLFRYFCFKQTYVTGELAIGEILTR